MSFSSKVKEELAKLSGKGRHCQLAEIAAILAFSGRIERTSKGQGLMVHSENPELLKKYKALLKTAFKLEGIEEHASVAVYHQEEVMKILHAIKWVNEQDCYVHGNELTDESLVHKICCKRAFIRGAFLAAGSMSDPEKSYHFEIVCPDEGKAEQLKNMINSFELDAKIVARKKNYVVYVKEGAQIVDMLNVMEAHVALMNLENVRILKEMRNSVNRQVNCETANINKTVNAAVRQVEDIQLIDSMGGLKLLPDNLREMAEVRLRYPDAALKELGTYMNPPVGKSGVNHRLRKINEIAEEIRRKNGV